MSSGELALSDVDAAIALAAGPVTEVTSCALVYHDQFLEVLGDHGCQLIPWWAIRHVTITYPLPDP